MNEIQILATVIIAIGVGILVWFLTKRPRQDAAGQALLMLQNQLQDLKHTLDAKLGESAKMFQAQFSESAKIIRDVTERLTKLDETNKQVVNFAEELQRLQDILQNPKQRGEVGEYYLETVLSNVLPPGSYKMQFEFRDGTKVDAAIVIKDKVIPIDSKFSLENYKRLSDSRDPAERDRFEKALRQDIKNRIDETAKYIKPAEGTMGFAFMFIPSEALFYDILVNKVGAVEARDLIKYAWERHVIIVSPTSFLAYLQTVLEGLRALKIQESAEAIRKRVEDLGRHLRSYETYMQKLGSNLGMTVSTYNAAYKELGKVDKDILRISDKAAGIEPVILPKPEAEEEAGE